jgi:hypothetical protein
MQPVEQRHLLVVRRFIPLLDPEHSLLILVLLLLSILWSLAVVVVERTTAAAVAQEDIEQELDYL